MTMRFDEQDKRAFAALDADFEISDGVAVISGRMEVAITRFTGDGVEQFRLRFKFPSEELLDVKIRRAQLLEQLDVDES